MQLGAVVEAGKILFDALFQRADVVVIHGWPLVGCSRYRASVTSVKKTQQAAS